ATEGGTEGAPEASNLYEVTLKPATIEMRSGSRRCEVKLGMQLQADIITRQESLLSFVLRKTRLLLDR
ncbi:MAG: HlyD family secretion protein, partial [Cyanobacteriota bacterium]